MNHHPVPHVPTDPDLVDILSLLRATPAEESLPHVLRLIADQIETNYVIATSHLDQITRGHKFAQGMSQGQAITTEYLHDVADALDAHLPTMATTST